ncbi:hypothetical protein NLM27_32500 [Bradyrhizobium sp. CCGB12]|uniref:hypothetical protein n=1 Tax=Bradyrhizobium sp. CCGB12 TaxID=2949632 RepID=UPI0020B18484|nr:hypothetical protein [Bradyrhizobium sp. CCGB12]MCP3393480.1 hypothetical protein [Bradyrhizobium sp. CCGB12]
MQDFLARTVAQLSARLPHLSRRRDPAPVLPKKLAWQPNGKLLFKIRISTEAEINGTVKGVV